MGFYGYLTPISTDGPQRHFCGAVGLQRHVNGAVNVSHLVNCLRTTIIQSKHLIWIPCQILISSSNGIDSVSHVFQYLCAPEKSFTAAVFIFTWRALPSCPRTTSKGIFPIVFQQLNGYLRQKRFGLMCLTFLLGIWIPSKGYPENCHHHQTSFSGDSSFHLNRPPSSFLENFTMILLLHHPNKKIPHITSQWIRQQEMWSQVEKERKKE